MEDGLDEQLEQIQQRIRLKSETSQPLSKGTDGSIKKNTSFIKKLKQGLTASMLPTLLKELVTLKQEKYLEEIAISIAEGLYKTTGDVLAAVELCSVLDKRYEDFLGMILPLVVKLLKTLSTPIATEKEEGVRLIKARSCMRLLVEMNLVGLAPDGKSKIVPGLLHLLLASDKALVNINLAVHFAKFYSLFYAPDAVLETAGLELRDQLISELIRQDCQKVLATYFKLVTTTLVKEHTRIQKMEKSNEDSFIARGEITEDRQETYEKRVKSCDKLKIAAETLSGYLKIDMPELQKEEEVTRMKIGISDGRVGGREEKDGGFLGIWEDEEQKSFYEKLLDLSNLVPPILLGIKSTSVVIEKEDSALVDLEDELNIESTSIDGEDAKSPAVEFAEVSVEEKQAETVELGNAKAQFNAIQTKLMNALGKESIDQIALEFAFINNKGTRRQLVQTLLGVSRQRLDLLPYYSRLIATLNPYMPDIGTNVVEELENSFHYHQKKKDQVFIEEKLKNIRFIAELTKFRITPNHVVFHCLQNLLNDFNFHNVELACSLLETCGRFLFFNPETNFRTANYLEILLRKKTVQNLDTKYSFMIDNAAYSCNPPEAVAVVRKVRLPIELFLRKLLYKDLRRSNVESILKLLRKANWKDTSVIRVMQKLFFKIWKAKASNVHLMAFLISELSRYYPAFGNAVVDNTLEEIRSGLEKNLFKHNQRRIAFIRFLGELYNYRMIDSASIFDTLYLLLRFGHAGGIPLPGVPSPLDACNDFFRLRLACTLLDTCGTYFNKGSAGKKLDNYLVFMQMYVFTKDPIPVDAEFFVMETLDLVRPKIELFKTYEECVNQVNLIARSEMSKVQEPEEDDEESNEGDEGSGRDPIEEDAAEEAIELDDNQEIDEDDEDFDEDDQAKDDDFDDDDEEAVIHENSLLDEDPEEDEMFEREFGRLMQESVDSRRNERKGVSIFDAPIPTRKQTAGEEDSIKDDEVAFTLLTKRGNKQHAKVMALPASSSFAILSHSKKEAELQERARLKSLVLRYEQRERQEMLNPTPTSNPALITQRRGKKNLLWSNTMGRGIPTKLEDNE